MPNFRVIAVPTQPKGTCIAGFHWRHPAEPRVVSAGALAVLRSKAPRLVNIISAEETTDALTPLELEARNTTVPVPTPPPARDKTEARLAQLEALMGQTAAKDAEIAVLRSQVESLTSPEKPAPKK